jgi:2-methylisocitrate lyase-like PEP mutase family enzyme
MAIQTSVPSDAAQAASTNSCLELTGHRQCLTQAEKGRAFRALHERAEAFIIPNPWDLGSARLLEGLRFEALATTSAGYAFSRGQRDRMVGRDAMIAHVAEIASTVNLPISVDLENGFGDDPQIVAETIRLAAAAGAVGGSIEDSTGRADQPLYERAHAVDRIRAAVAAARALPFRFTLTARAENFLFARPDVEDAIQRLQAYQEAGADVLYAPGLPSADAISSLVRSVDRPVNVVMGLKGPLLTLASLSALGVKRVSVGSALSRCALGALFRAVHEMRESGTFTWSTQAAKFADITALLSK